MRLCTFVHIIKSDELRMGSQQGKIKLLEASRQVADAVGVFEDENALTIQDENTIEDRFITIGTDYLSHIVVVVYTFRDSAIRIISARKATARERKMYEE